MKILSYLIVGDMLRVFTDNSSRPEFVYFKERFDSLEKLEAEINKSISMENKRKEKKEFKLNKLKGELDARKQH